MRTWNRGCRSLWAAAVVVLWGAAPARAEHEPARIAEIMTGANGDSRVQFVELDPGAGPRCWGPQRPGTRCFCGVAEAASRMRLVFHDGLGREVGQLEFPHDPPRGRRKVLVATAELAALPGAPVPDFVMPPLLSAVSGKVCLRGNPDNPSAPDVRRCLSYGDFAADADGGGAPAPSLGITGTRSLVRGRHGDYVLSTRPSPTNAAGATFAMPLAALAVQGEVLFKREAFQGNGRTCESCHLAAESFGLKPATVQARFEAVAETYDPLFIAETVGFDFNLNTLVLQARPQPHDLRGVVRGATGVAKVLGRIGPTTYLVYGGLTPPLSGTVSDGTSSATVAGITAGDLDGLEDPSKMHLVDSRGRPRRPLIKVHVDGFDRPHVFRKSPHLLNLRYTAPYGLSGEFADLRSFSRAAVVQHFPRSLARVPGVDFREPTDEELRALEAFQLAQELPPGDDPDKFDLDRFATTARQRLGRQVFFGPAAKCSRCHGGRLLNESDGTVGKPPGLASIDTGVSNLQANGPGRDDLPPELGPVHGASTREFNVPSLFNVRNLGPYLHDAAFESLSNAVTFFYSTGEFLVSPGGRAVGFIDFFGEITPEENVGLFAFLNGLVVRPYTLAGGPVGFGGQPVDAGPTAARPVVITNTSASPITFAAPACALTGAHAGEFAIADCPLASPLAPGESRTIQVTFDPSAAGARAAILEVNAPDPSGVDLSGNGTGG